MIKTQVQLPDDLYHTAKKIAKQREWSLTEVVRRGLEHMAVLYPIRTNKKGLELPILNAARFRRDFDKLDLKALVESDDSDEI